EKHVSVIKVAQKVDVSIEAYQRRFEGHVSRINPQIDDKNRTFQIEVVIANPEHLLPPGAFARAQVHTHTDERVVFVPQEAVVSFAGVNKVFTVSDGKAVEHAIELGERQGDYVEAARGLSGTEAVVVGGASKLAHGVAVTVQKTESVKSVATAAPR